MIQYIKIKNFLSFKDEVVFNFEATKDKKFEDYQVVEIAPGVRILRIAVVYGANASGKTNLVSAIEFLRNFWFQYLENKDQSTGAIPFLLSSETPNQPSEFSIGFYIGQKKYVYNLTVGNNVVLNEKLQIYPSQQPATIYERVTVDGISQITFNPKRVKLGQAAKEQISLYCLQNVSVFAAYNKVNVGAEEMDTVMNWAKAHFTFQHRMGLEDNVAYTESIISRDESKKGAILNFLQRADYNITGIDIQQIERAVPDELIPLLIKSSEGVPVSEIERLKRDKTITMNIIDFEHCITNEKGEKEYYKLPKNLQSDGTIRTFGLSGVIDHAVETNSFITIDEIEDSLHPALIEFIVEDFLKHKGESQMLVTTHYDGLLEADDLLRNDSIWFTSKKENGATDLYSLVDFKGINRITSLQKAYRYGQFGAIPNI